MIISRTPLRVSFVGGGSDLASFYSRSPGAVVSTAINKYIYIFVNQKFDQKIRASYSVTEIVDKVGGLKHDLIRESLKLLKIKGGIEITSISDIPSEGTGLGSSSSYLVGLLNALHVYKGDYVSAETLAREACHIEIDILKKPIGKQDQYAAAYGGFNYFKFNSNDTVLVEPIILDKKTRESVDSYLLFFYTGLTRTSSSVLKKQKRNLATNADTFKQMQMMVDLAIPFRDALRGHYLSRIGKFIHENWLLKKRMAKEISNPQIDKWYNKAIKSGASGGKLLGAGGGGFLLFWVPPQKQKRVIKALQLPGTPIHLEPFGSKIIYVEE